MHYRVEQSRGFAQVECLRRTFGRVGTKGIMLHVEFTTPSTKAVVVPRLLFAVHISWHLGPQTLVRRYVLTSYRGRRKGQMMGTNWKRWKGN